MKKTIDFDVDQIVAISFKPSYHDNYYEWRLATSITKYKKILWFNKQIGFKETQTGFHCLRTYQSFCEKIEEYEFISEENIKKSGFIIREYPERIENKKEVWAKAKVEVYLSYKIEVVRYFETDQEANDWIVKLRLGSRKFFETFLK